MITIGIMTSKSSDSVNAVMTDFRGSVTEDIASVSIPYSTKFKKQITDLRKKANKLKGNMLEISHLPMFNEVLDNLTDLQIKAVNTLLEVSNIAKGKVTAIGISGLNICDYPVISEIKSVCSTQIFKPAKLAKEVGIDVVYDFAADDIIGGGRGYPFMPVHLLHLSSSFASSKDFPVCFIDGGKTARMTLITESLKSIKRRLISFDCGAFNFYVDALNKLYPNIGNTYSITGDINSYLLAELYKSSALLPDGSNFYDMPYPKVADIHYYGMLEKLKNYPLQKEDVLRTVQYFAAYVTFMSLRFIPNNVDFPKCFVVFGKGWNNQVICHDFQSLLHGRGVILSEHKKIYADILVHMRGSKFSFGESSVFNINSQYMEARAFADMAYYYMNGSKFNKSEITDCHKESICGTICRAGENTRRRGAGFTYSRVAIV